MLFIYGYVRGGDNIFNGAKNRICFEREGEKYEQLLKFKPTWKQVKLQLSSEIGKGQIKVGGIKYHSKHDYWSALN